MTLLGPADPAPVIEIARPGASPFLFCCDHAGAEIPARLGRLGMAEADLNDHIAIDIGIFAVVSWLSGLIGAPMLAQPYSRLVIDCNRRPGTPGSIPEVSDARPVPGNCDLTSEARAARAAEILIPYQSRIAEVLAERRAVLGHPPVLMAMHSFTRALRGRPRRACDVGVIFEAPNPLGAALLAALRAETDLTVLENEPYRIGLTEDYTLPVHALGQTQPYVEIEICQDLIADCAGQRRMAGIFARALARLSLAQEILHV